MKRIAKFSKYTRPSRKTGSLPGVHQNTFDMFKYIANMLMLMNGTAAVTLLTKSPETYHSSIFTFAVGCSIPALLYIVAYASYCDIVLKHIKFRNGYTNANVAILTAFVVSLGAFCFGVYKF